MAFAAALAAATFWAWRLEQPVTSAVSPALTNWFAVVQEVTDLVRTKGLFSFYEDGHTECCRIRKVRSPTLRSHPIDHERASRTPKRVWHGVLSPVAALAPASNSGRKLRGG